MSERIYRSSRRVRLSDADPAGRLRLDAMVRYAQDVATDDVDDAGLENPAHVWIVRRMELRVVEAFRGDRAVQLATWSMGLGQRWALRGTRIEGAAGGVAELATTWVFVEATSLRPARLPQSYWKVYGGDVPAPSGRLRLEPRPSAPARAEPWTVRTTDLDVLGHVNNAVHWQALEHSIRDDSRRSGRLTALMEYRRGLDFGVADLCVAEERLGVRMWLLQGGETAAAAALDWPPT